MPILSRGAQVSSEDLTLLKAVEHSPLSVLNYPQRKQVWSILSLNVRETILIRTCIEVLTKVARNEVALNSFEASVVNCALETSTLEKVVFENPGIANALLGQLITEMGESEARLLQIVNWVLHTQIHFHQAPLRQLGEDILSHSMFNEAQRLGEETLLNNQNALQIIQYCLALVPYWNGFRAW